LDITRRPPTGESVEVTDKPGDRYAFRELLEFGFGHLRCMVQFSMKENHS
jgi:hypothetical protein